MKKNLLTGICFGVVVFCFATSEAAAQTETVSLQTNKPKSVQERLEHAAKRHALAEPESFAKAYADFKKDLQDKMGLSYSADISIMGQRGAPNGKGTPWQTQYYGSVNWDMFTSKIGSGSCQADKKLAQAPA